MQNQNELKCDGCGQQFNNRNDLQKHQNNCAAFKSRSSSGSGQGQQPLTRGAGSSQNKE